MVGKNWRASLSRSAFLYAFFIIVVSAAGSMTVCADSAVTADISVPATYSTGMNRWFDTGADIEKGAVLSIHSNGVWRLGAGPRECNANGLSNFPPYNGHLFGTLMGKIGANGTPFPIGVKFYGNANATGRLFLGNNDSNSGDNSGSIDVSIKVGKKPVVSVPATYSTGMNRWFDTGVDIEKGAVLSIHSNGVWRLGAGPRECNANGLSNFPPYNGHLFGTLMGKIGANGTPFLIGVKFHGNANATGRLFLGNNDSNSGDNSGSIDVSIEIR